MLSTTLCLLFYSIRRHAARRWVLILSNFYPINHNPINHLKTVEAMKQPTFAGVSFVARIRICMQYRVDNTVYTYRLK